MKRPWYNFIYVRSPIAKILLGGAALLLTLALFGFTFIIEEPRMEAQTNSWTGRSIEKGAEIFANNCTSCHGVDGKGNQAVGAPNLTDKVWLYGSSEAVIAEGINKGRNVTATTGTTTMPSFKDQLGAARIHLVAAYVWSLSNSAAPAAK